MYLHKQLPHISFPYDIYDIFDNNSELYNRIKLRMLRNVNFRKKIYNLDNLLHTFII